MTKTVAFSSQLMNNCQQLPSRILGRSGAKAMRVQCPACQASLKLPESQPLPRYAACPKCERHFTLAIASPQTPETVQHAAVSNYSVGTTPLPVAVPTAESKSSYTVLILGGLVAVLSIVLAVVVTVLVMRSSSMEREPHVAVVADASLPKNNENVLPPATPGATALAKEVSSSGNPIDLLVGATTQTPNPLLNRPPRPPATGNVIPSANTAKPPKVAPSIALQHSESKSGFYNHVIEPQVPAEIGFSSYSPPIKSLAMSRDGKTLAAALNDGSVAILATDTWQEMGRIKNAEAPLALSNNGQYIIASVKRQTAMYRVGKLDEPYRMGSLKEIVLRVSISDRGDAVAASGRSVLLLRADDDSERELALESNAEVVDISSDSKYWAVIGNDGICRVVDFQSGEEIRSARVCDPSKNDPDDGALRFSPDAGHLWVAVGPDVRKLRLPELSVVENRTFRENTRLQSIRSDEIVVSSDLGIEAYTSLNDPPTRKFALARNSELDGKLLCMGADFAVFDDHSPQKKDKPHRLGVVDLAPYLVREISPAKAVFPHPVAVTHSAFANGGKTLVTAAGISISGQRSVDAAAWDTGAIGTVARPGATLHIAGVVDSSSLIESFAVDGRTSSMAVIVDTSTGLNGYFWNLASPTAKKLPFPPGLNRYSLSWNAAHGYILAGKPATEPTGSVYFLKDGVVSGRVAEGLPAKDIVPYVSPDGKWLAYLVEGRDYRDKHWAIFDLSSERGDILTNTITYANAPIWRGGTDEVLLWNARQIATCDLVKRQQTEVTVAPLTLKSVKSIGSTPYLVARASIADEAVVDGYLVFFDSRNHRWLQVLRVPIDRKKALIHAGLAVADISRIRGSDPNAELKRLAAVSTLAVSPDGTLIAAGTIDGNVHLFETASLLSDFTSESSPSLPQPASTGVGDVAAAGKPTAPPMLVNGFPLEHYVAVTDQLAPSGDLRTYEDAFKALGTFAKPAVPQLIKLMDREIRKNESLHVEYICDAIERMGPDGKDAVKALIKAIPYSHGDGPQPFRALGAIGPDAAEAIPAVTAFLMKEQSGTRYAVDALAKIGGAAALSGLAKAIDSSPASSVRIAAIEALGTIQSPAGDPATDLVPMLLKLLDNSDPAVVRKSIETILRLDRLKLASAKIADLAIKRQLTFAWDLLEDNSRDIDRVIVKPMLEKATTDLNVDTAMRAQKILQNWALSVR